MFRSNFDVLNLLNNPLLQDPDAVGSTGFTRGDCVVQKWWIHHFKKVPFSIIKKVPPNINEALHSIPKLGTECRTLNHNNNDNVNHNDHDREIVIKEVVNSGTNGGELSIQKDVVNSATNVDELSIQKDVDEIGARAESMKKKHVCEDGDTRGYYPRLPLRLSFSDFMDAFFRVEKCVTRAFMVWNLLPWMYTVRHQRGLESLLSHHPDACVVVFSETVELDFFKESFVKDGCCCYAES